MLRRLLPALLLVLVISGCVRQHVDMTVHQDGKQIDIDMIAAADSEWAAREGIDLNAKSAEQQVDASSFGPEARWEDWQEDKWIGKRLLAPNTPIENVLTGGLLSYSVTGDQIEFKTSPLQLGWGTQSANLEEVVNSDADLRLRVRVPGKVEETNGQLDGEWVVWTTKDAALEAFTIRATASQGAAQSSPSSAAPKPTPTPAPQSGTQDGTPWWIWVVGLVVAAGVGYGVYRFTGKRGV